MILPVWIILDDGPCAGHVDEMGIHVREIEVKTCHDGVCCYRRTSYDINTGVAHFRFTKTKVV